MTEKVKELPRASLLHDLIAADQELKYPRNVLLNKFGSHIDSEFNALERHESGANTELLDFFDRIRFSAT